MVIDFHSYVQPKTFLERLRKRRAFPRIERSGSDEYLMSAPGMARKVRPEQNDIGLRLEAMSLGGVDAQVLRMQNVSGVDAFDIAEGIDIAMAGNEEVSEIARSYPGRFIPFAAIPMRDPSIAAKELKRAVKTLGHAGVGLSVACEGRAVDSADYDCVFAAAAETRAITFLLPNHPSTVDGVLAPHNWLSAAFGFQVDLSLIALRLLCGGLTRRYPELPLVLANLGGVYPFVMERIEKFWERMPVAERPFPERPSLALRRFYLATASSQSESIALAAKVIGADRLLFGSDYPSFEFKAAVSRVRESGLSEAEMELVFSKNALTLIKARGALAN